MEQNTIKVLICDNTAETGVKIASHLQEAGFYAYTRNNDINALLQTIINDEPDIVISDISLGSYDAIMLLEEVKLNIKKEPLFVIISEYENNFLKRQAIENGAAYFVSKPIDLDNFTRIIKNLAEKLPCQRSNDIEIMVTDLIRSVGIPAHIKGYQYLRTAIINSVYDPSLIEGVTKLLYPSVAAKHNSTPSRVERAIRHSIDIAWERGDRAVIAKYFGSGSNNYPFKPTNSEFIALFTDMIRLKLKKM